MQKKKTRMLTTAVNLYTNPNFIRKQNSLKGRKQTV